MDIITEVSSAQSKSIQLVSGPIHGGSHVVYEIQAQDPNGEEGWCLRIPRDTDAATFAEKGSDILRYVKTQRPALRAPFLVSRSEHYTLMESFDGGALESWNTRSLSKEWRQKLLDELAVFLFSLWTIEPDAPPDTGKRANFLLGIYVVAERESRMQEIVQCLA